MFLRHARRLLHTGVRLLRKRGSQLSQQERFQYEHALKTLEAALRAKEKGKATEAALQVKAWTKSYFPKTFGDYLRELSYALVFALLVAFCIRQFWFELYEVPTGSMRPTVEELDRMVISRTTFGLRLPFSQKTLFFSEKNLQRGSSLIFTVRGMEIPDSDMRYFYLIPGKKRFIKRCMGKPGDTLYFYGGYIYGIDREGREILELADPHWLSRYGLERIDHVPFITFSGNVEVTPSSSFSQSALFRQMNQPVGKIAPHGEGKWQGTFYNGKEWVVDRPEALKSAHTTPVSYSDLWGMGNYAMARLLTPAQVEAFYQQTPDKEALLYLELHHTPNLTYPKPVLYRDARGEAHPVVSSFTTLLPLQRPHLEALQKAMITSRFYVEKGRAFRYAEGEGHSPKSTLLAPLFPGVPDGLYEFYYGVGYQIHFGGVQTPLPADHPLYATSPENLQTLFNLGIGFHTLLVPRSSDQFYMPQRFAYYREGALYVMGSPLMEKEDPHLLRFIEQEKEKQRNSSREAPYIAFVDHGPPLREGKLDRAYLDAFGFKVPEGTLLALGDNYAMSADSRDFGMVPINNLLGSASFTFWPPGKRIGPFPQPPYPWFTPSQWVVGGVLLLLLLLWAGYTYKKNRTIYFT